MPRQPFVIGELVTWTSSAAGSTTTKIGVVIAVVAGIWKGRDHESYVVKVTPPSKRHPNDKRPRKPVIYWPIASKLRPAKVKE